MEREPNDIPSPETSVPAQKRRSRRILWWIVGILLSPLVLILIVGLLLYLPPIQRKVVNYASTKVSEASGYNISIGDVHIAFPLKVKVGEVLARSTSGDTIAYLDRADVNVALIPLLNGNIHASGAGLEDLRLHYFSPDSLLSIVGKVGSLNVTGFAYDGTSQLMDVSKIWLSDTDVTVFNGDTVPKKDTTQTKSRLRIHIDDAKLENVLGSYAQVRDSALVNVHIHEGRIYKGDVNLDKEYYTAEKIRLDTRLYRIGANIESLPLPWDVRLNAYKPYYDSLYIHAKFHELAYTTADHWGVTNLTGEITIDSTRLEAKDLVLEMPRSGVEADVSVPMRHFVPDTVGDFRADIRGDIYLREFQRFLSKGQEIPDRPVKIDVQGEGQLNDKVTLKGFVHADDMADLRLDGVAYRPMDFLRRDIKADYNLVIGNLMDYLPTLGVQASSWRIPSGTRLNGELTYSPRKAATKSVLTTPAGSLTAEGYFAPPAKEFKGYVTVNQMDLRQFLPNDTLTYLDGHLIAEGHGTDPFSIHTRADLFVILDSVIYKGMPYRDITLLSKLKEHQFFAALNSDNEGLSLTAQVDAILKKKDVQGSINVMVDTIAPSRIGLKSGILRGASFELRSTLLSDLKEYYDFKGELENSIIETDKRILEPGNIYLSALSTSDSLRANVRSGDLVADFRAENGLKDFLNRVKYVSKEVEKITVDTVAIRNMRPWIDNYPTMKLSVNMGRENPVRYYLDERRIGWRNFSLNLGTTTQEGLTGDIYVNSFQKDTFRIDEMDMLIRQDTAFFYTVASAHKERFRNQKPFNIMLSLNTNIKRTELYTNWKDSKEQEFFQLGMDVTRGQNHDLTVRFTPDPPILAYNRFEVVGDNYVLIPSDDKLPIRANMKLVSDRDASIVVTDSVTTAGSSVNLKINNFGLERIKSLAIVPDMDGILNLNAAWVKAEMGNIFAGDLGIKGFHFRRMPVGDLRVTGGLTPQKTGNYIIADLALDGKKVGDTELFMPKSKSEKTRWEAKVDNLPMEKVNPFLPKNYADVTGYLDAHLYNYNTNTSIITAHTGNINGELVLKESSLFVPRLNERYKLDQDPIQVRENILYLRDFGISTDKDNRLVTDGTVSLTPNLPLDLRITGRDLRLLDSKQTTQTSLFGVIGVDTRLQLQGPAKTLNVTGDLSINGNTNVTYVSQDGELQKRDRFAGLVEFTDFSDTLFVVKKNAVDSLSLGGMNVRLNLHIDPAVRVTALLNRDESNKVSIQGGGDLNFSMPPYGKMSLAGTYEIREGYIHYSLPGMGKKQFTVDRDSRAIWSGDLLNPVINFKATSRVKSNISMPGESPRKVNFDVSIIARNSLDDLALIFDLEAPEDLSMRNILASMTEEERSRQALLLLATGYFLGSQPTGAGFDANSALTSLLASELNSLAGEALDAEINFGVEEAAPELGGGTNYSYSIAKRFYSDRISIVVGGKVETGANALGYQQSFIDNISLDYRIDQAGTHYFRIFHKKNYENLLDGEVIETGVGYVLRRRLNRIRDIFKFTRPERQFEFSKPDSLAIPETDSLTMLEPQPALEPKE